MHLGRDERGMASLTCIDGSAAMRSSAASAWRLDDYLTIMGHVRATDVSLDTDFQRVCDRFCVVHAGGSRGHAVIMCARVLGPRTFPRASPGGQTKGPPIPRGRGHWQGRRLRKHGDHRSPRARQVFLRARGAAAGGLGCGRGGAKAVPPTFSVDGTSATVGGQSFAPGSHSSHE